MTAELALRLGRYFNQNPRYWVNLQSRYDLDVAEDFLAKQISCEVKPMAVRM
jgi:plasmid maintenance system antidote protein VapI